MNDQPFHGGNTPLPPAPLTPAEIKSWLDYDMAPLLELRSERLTAIQAIAASFSSIDDDETLGEIAENVRMVKALVKTADNRRTDQKRPFLEGGRAVDAWFRLFGAPFDAPLAAIQAVMDAYGKRKLAAAKEAAEAEFAAAKRRAEETAAAAAAALAERPTVAEQHIIAATEAAEAAHRASEMMYARPAEHTRVYSDTGAVSSLRTSVRYDITDPDLVPREYMMINHDKVKFAAKERDRNGKPTAVIPGITWVVEHSMGVR